MTIFADIYCDFAQGRVFQVNTGFPINACVCMMQRWLNLFLDHQLPVNGLLQKIVLLSACDLVAGAIGWHSKHRRIYCVL